MVTFKFEETAQSYGNEQLILTGISHDYELGLWVTDQNYEQTYSLTLKDYQTGKTYLSENSSDWAMFDKVFPRYLWPEQINAGQKNKTRTPQPELVVAIEKDQQQQA